MIALYRDVDYICLFCWRTGQTCLSFVCIVFRFQVCVFI